MDVEYYSDCISKKARSIAQHLTKHLGMAALAVIITLGLTAEASAIYLQSDFIRAGNYIDKEKYYFLDYGQYYYLDKGQYNLIGGLSYYLGHPFYPKLHQKGINQKIGFTDTINKAWFIFLAEKFPVGDYAQRSDWCFNAGEAVYKQRYYFSDTIKYNYFDKGQYNLLATSTYPAGYLRYQRQFTGIINSPNVSANPEPSTIVFLGLGAVGIIAFRRKNKKERTA